MKLAARQLDSHLANTLAHAYLISGDEPLLVAEAALSVVKAARARGFDERDLSVPERSFKWVELEATAQTGSLFAARRIIELRLPTGRPGEQGARVIARLAERPDPDRLLLVVTGKLDAAAARSAWVKSIEAAGVHVQLWPLERAELPGWLRMRAQRLELELAAGAAELLADRVEGNLLAAAQELEKLALARGPGRVEEATVLESVASSARFDVFRLTDAVATGNARRAVAVLDGLRAEGVEPVLVSWALNRELSLLLKLKFAAGRGPLRDDLLTRHGVWHRRQATVKQALARLSWNDLKGLLAQAAEVDSAVKGVGRVTPWQALTGLVLAILNPQGRRARVRLGA